MARTESGPAAGFPAAGMLHQDPKARYGQLAGAAVLPFEVTPTASPEAQMPNVPAN
jgi:hypothetical protein